MQKIRTSLLALALVSAVGAAGYISSINGGEIFSNQTAAAAAIPLFLKNLHVGMKHNSDVARLQTFLRYQGFYSGISSGTYSSTTAAALKKFQHAHHLTASGYFGPATRSIINTMLMSANSTAGAPPTQCDSQSSCTQLCQKSEDTAACQGILQKYQTNNSFASAGNGTDPLAAGLPSCTTNAVFDHVPTSDINFIEGLGHTFGEHIVPAQADHIYLYPSRDDANVTVYAPGDVTLVQVTAQKHTGGMDSRLGTDYSYIFSPCKSVMFGFIHVRTPSDRIAQALTAITPSCGDQGTLASNCVYQNLGLKLTSGEVIGMALGNGDGLDFGGTDTRTPALGFINKQDLTGGMLSNSYFHTICPLDYFTSSLKTELYAKIKIQNPGAGGIPACGSIMQDKAGTAEGNWYQPGVSYISNGDNLTKLLALVHYNLDPSEAVLSAGSKLLPTSDLGAQIIYHPSASGFINRDPADIQPDGHIYCIEGQLTTNYGTSGHVDIQMQGANTLYADYGSGDCSANPTLSNYVTYAR